MPSSNVHEQYPIIDYSDTSDEESNAEDNYPDPHPSDPDMTGWSPNQVGCYLYGRYKHFKKHGATSRVHANRQATAQRVHEHERVA